MKVLQTALFAVLLSRSLTQGLSLPSSSPPRAQSEVNNETVSSTSADQAPSLLNTSSAIPSLDHFSTDQSLGLFNKSSAASSVNISSTSLNDDEPSCNLSPAPPLSCEAAYNYFSRIFIPGRNYVLCRPPHIIEQRMPPYTLVRLPLIVEANGCAIQLDIPPDTPFIRLRSRNSVMDPLTLVMDRCVRDPLFRVGGQLTLQLSALSFFYNWATISVGPAKLEKEK